jgi:hypothetical protein
MTPTHSLPARPGLAEAEALLEELRAPDALAAPIVIDAAAVEELPAACALVLASLVRARPGDAPRVGVIAPSPAFVDAFSDLGLFQDLMKMEFAQ